MERAILSLNGNTIPQSPNYLAGETTPPASTYNELSTFPMKEMPKQLVEQVKVSWLMPPCSFSIEPCNYPYWHHH
jgi:hypothetical protein